MASEQPALIAHIFRMMLSVPLGSDVHDLHPLRQMRTDLQPSWLAADDAEAALGKDVRGLEVIIAMTDDTCAPSASCARTATRRTINEDDSSKHMRMMLTMI